ncbi:MAG: hypothetical protein GF392_02975 [Candidatus Omnitrophica bacterium]|nr:hypothetical protein [Candidatus Omnitrophota bacterium]
MCAVYKRLSFLILIFYLFVFSTITARSDDFGENGWSGNRRARKNNTTDKRLSSYERNVSTQSIRNYTRNKRPEKSRGTLPSYTKDRSRK